MGSNRRDFLRRSAMSAATAFASSAVFDTTQAVSAQDPLQILDNDVKWDKAPCRFCGTGCHVQVGVQEGRVVAIAGDKSADVNKGLLCVKGYHVGGILYGKDRLTKPQLRVDGELVEISWDRALDILAEKVMESPEKFAFYGSGQWTIPEGFAAQKLMKAGLSNNHIEPNARLCMASAVTGFVSTYGVDEPAGCYDDLDECDVAICWGNNPAEMHPVLFSRLIDRRLKGEKVMLIDIGTRKTRTTEYADHYLEMAPQSDLAIANGIAHLLIKNETYDKEFVAKHCNFRGETAPVSLMGEAISFEEYASRLEKYTPEYVEQISGIPAESIRMLGKLFGQRDQKITSLWCMGMNQHTQGTAINRLVHGIHLLSGHFGKPGDAPTSLTGQPAACGTAREVGTLCHALPGGRLVAKEDHRNQCEDFWNVPRGRINPTVGYHTVKMWDRFAKPTTEGGDITTMFVQVTNPGQSLPNLYKNFKGKQGLEDKFLVVSEVYPTATTELADLILPASLWVEKNGIFGNSERRTQQWYKMVDPPGDARDDCWMTIALARKLFELGHPGMRDKDGKFLFHMEDETGQEIQAWNWETYYQQNVDQVLYEEYRPFTYMKHKNLAPYDVLAKARGLRWPVVKQNDGSWRETRFRFSEFDDPFVEPGTDIQFYHSTTGDNKAQIWFCPYLPAPEEPDAEFPFWLCTGRVLEHWHTGTMTTRIPQLKRSVPQAYVEMNPEDARQMSLSNGDLVTLETRRGKLQLPVWLEGRSTPPRGSLFVPFFDERLMINDLTLDATCPISFEPDYKKCAARVVRSA